MANIIKNILFVDDELFIITPVLQYLSERGYHVVATNSPEAVMSLMHPDRFDVIITDIQMRPVSGIDLIRQLRSAGFAGKIIVISGFCNKNEIEMEAPGVNAFFEKPFKLQDIHNKIKEWTNEDESSCK